MKTVDFEEAMNFISEYPTKNAYEIISCNILVKVLDCRYNCRKRVRYSDLHDAVNDIIIDMIDRRDIEQAKWASWFFALVLSDLRMKNDKDFAKDFRGLDFFRK